MMKFGQPDSSYLEVDSNKKKKLWFPLSLCINPCIACGVCLVLSVLLVGVLVALIVVIAVKDPPRTPRYIFNTPLDFYSEDPRTAAEKFSQLCHAANGTHESYIHPLRGKHNETLSSAICRFNKPNIPTNTFFLYSGCHGIEGYLGSAVQLGILKDISTHAYVVDPHINLVMYHMEQPWGASYMTKENEDNIDQLKNDEEMYTSYSLWNNTLFHLFDDALDLAHLGDAAARDRAIAAVTALKMQYGMQLGYALVLGQSTRPKSLAYAGSRPTWAHETLRRVAANHLSQASRLMVLSLHTAVGPYGGTHVFNEAPPGSREQALIQGWLPKATPGMIPLPQPSWHWFKRISPDVELLSMTIEAGTYEQSPDMEVCFALNNYCRFHDPSPMTNPLCTDADAKYKDFFYPADPAWRRWAFANTTADVLTAIAGFASYVAAPRTPDPVSLTGEIQLSLAPVKDFVSRQMEALSPTWVYHTRARTLDRIYPRALDLCVKENGSLAECKRVGAAALYHAIGYLVGGPTAWRYSDVKALSAQIASQQLPIFPEIFSAQETAEIVGWIAGTNTTGLLYPIFHDALISDYGSREWLSYAGQLWRETVGTVPTFPSFLKTDAYPDIQAAAFQTATARDLWSAALVENVQNTAALIPPD